jgi:hypothetical protein
MTEESNELEQALKEVAEHWAAIQRELAARHLERGRADYRRDKRKPWKGRFKASLVKKPPRPIVEVPKAA